MSGAPFMRFYFGDYDRDTGHLRGPAEHGAYFMLIKAMWNAGGKLPADDKKLARLTQTTDKEWAAIKPLVLPFFKRRGGVLRHTRIDAELLVYANAKLHASKAGKASAFQKANKINKKSSTPVQRPFNQPEPEPEGSKKGLIDNPFTTFDASEPARPEGAGPPRLVVVEKESLEQRKALAAEVLSSLKVRS